MIGHQTHSIPDHKLKNKIQRLTFILSYLILSYLILSYLILSYLILSYLILSYLILSYLILSYLILSHLILSHLILSVLFSSHLISSHLISSHLTSRLNFACTVEKSMISISNITLSCQHLSTMTGISYHFTKILLHSL